jgi:hypothetical protein
MITIYVRHETVPIISVDGRRMTVKCMWVADAGNQVALPKWEPSSPINQVSMVLQKRFRPVPLPIPPQVSNAIVHFLQKYHARQNVSFDCYAFSNLVAGVTPHQVTHMLRFWKRRPLPFRLPIGSVVFFESGIDGFHHAAVYIGHHLYLSVWGAGGDLEVATLRSMKRDFGASRIVLGEPIPK